MECSNCKHIFYEDVDLCPKCGNKIDKNKNWKIALIITAISFAVPSVSSMGNSSSTLKFLCFFLFIVFFSIAWFLIEKYKCLKKTKISIIVGLVFTNIYTGMFLALLEESPDMLIIYGFSFTFIFSLIIYIVKQIYTKEFSKFEDKMREKKEKEIKKELGLVYSDIFLHSYGLPCTLNSNLKIGLREDSILFLLNNEKTVKLPKEKIKSIQTKTEKELVESYSKAQTNGGLGGAIIGGLTFGALGAIVGSNISTRQTDSTTKYKYNKLYYVLITYFSNGENGTIALISDSLDKANELTEKCNELYTEKEIVL